MNNDLKTVHEHCDVHDWKYFNLNKAFKYRYCECCKLLHFYDFSAWNESRYTSPVDRRKDIDGYMKRFNAALEKGIYLFKEEEV